MEININAIMSSEKFNINDFYNQRKNFVRKDVDEELGIQVVIEKTIPIELFTSNDSNFFYHTFILIIEKEFMPNLNSEHCGYAWVSMEGWPAPLHPGVFSTLKLDSIKDKIKVIVDTI